MSDNTNTHGQAKPRFDPTINYGHVLIETLPDPALDRVRIANRFRPEKPGVSKT